MSPVLPAVSVVCNIFNLERSEVFFGNQSISVTLSQTRPCVYVYFFNPFPHDKILDQTKFKAFADDKLNITKMIISVFDRVKNIFSKGFFCRGVKRCHCVGMGKDTVGKGEIARCE